MSLQPQQRGLSTTKPFQRPPRQLSQDSETFTPGLGLVLYLVVLHLLVEKEAKLNNYVWKAVENEFEHHQAVEKLGFSSDNLCGIQRPSNQQP